MSVELHPSTQLGFQRPFTQVVKRILQVTNNNAQPVAFKVKTTAPKLYCVRPNCGRVEPGETIDVAVLLQPMKEDPPLNAKCKDKFLFQSTFITTEREQGSISKLWASAEKATDENRTRQQKIRVVYLPADGEGIPEEQEQPHYSMLSADDTMVNRYETVRETPYTNGHASVIEREPEYPFPVVSAHVPDEPPEEAHYDEAPIRQPEHVPAPVLPEPVHLPSPRPTPTARPSEPTPVSVPPLHPPEESAAASAAATTETSILAKYEAERTALLSERDEKVNEIERLEQLAVDLERVKQARLAEMARLEEQHRLALLHQTENARRKFGLMVEEHGKTVRALEDVIGALREELEAERRKECAACAEKLYTINSLKAEHADTIRELERTVIAAGEDAEAQKATVLEIETSLLRAKEKHAREMAETNSSLKSEHVAELGQQRESLASAHAEHDANIMHEQRLAIEQLNAEHAAAISDLQIQKEKEVNSLATTFDLQAQEHESILAEVRRKADQDIVESQEYARRQVADLEQLHQKDVEAVRLQTASKLEEYQAQQIKQLEEKHAHTYENYKKSQQKKVHELRAKHEEEMEEVRASLKAANDTTIQRLEAEREVVVAALQQEKAAEIESHKREHQVFLNIIRTLKLKAESDLAKAEEAHQSHIARLSEEYRFTVDELTADAERAKEAHAREMAGAVSSLRAEHQSAIDMLRESLVEAHVEHEAGLLRAHREAVEKLEAEHGKAMSALRAEADVEVGELRTKLDSQKLAHEACLAALAEKAQRDLSELEAQHRSKLASLQQIHDADLVTACTSAAEEVEQRLELAHSDLIKALEVAHAHADENHKKSHQKKVHDLNAKHEHAMDALRVTLAAANSENESKLVRAHEGELERLRFEHAEAMALLRSEKDAEVESHQREHKVTLQTIAAVRHQAESDRAAQYKRHEHHLAELQKVRRVLVEAARAETEREVSERLGKEHAERVKVIESAHSHALHHLEHRHHKHVEELKASHHVAIAELQRSLEAAKAESESAQREHDVEMQVFRNEHTALVSGLRAEIDDLNAQIRVRDQQREERGPEFDERTDELRRAHEAAVGHLESQHRRVSQALVAEAEKTTTERLTAAYDAQLEEVREDVRREKEVHAEVRRALVSLRTEHESEVDALRSTLDATYAQRDAVVEKHADSMRAMKDEHSIVVAGLRAELDAEVLKLTAKLVSKSKDKDFALQQVKSQMSSEIAYLKEQHTSTISELERAHQMALQQMEAQATSELEISVRQRDSAVSKLEEALSAAREKHGRAVEELVADKDEDFETQGGLYAEEMDVVRSQLVIVQNERQHAREQVQWANEELIAIEARHSLALSEMRDTYTQELESTRKTQETVSEQVRQVSEELEDDEQQKQRQASQLMLIGLERDNAKARIDALESQLKEAGEVHVRLYTLLEEARAAAERPHIFIGDRTPPRRRSPLRDSVALDTPEMTPGSDYTDPSK